MPRSCGDSITIHLSTPAESTGRVRFDIHLPLTQTPRHCLCKFRVQANSHASLLTDVKDTQQLAMTHLISDSFGGSCAFSKASWKFPFPGADSPPAVICKYVNAILTDLQNQGFPDNDLPAPAVISGSSAAGRWLPSAFQFQSELLRIDQLHPGFLLPEI